MLFPFQRTGRRVCANVTRIQSASPLCMPVFSDGGRLLLGCAPLLTLNCLTLRPCRAWEGGEVLHNAEGELDMLGLPTMSDLPVRTQERGGGQPSQEPVCVCKCRRATKRPRALHARSVLAACVAIASVPLSVLSLCTCSS